MSHSPTDNICVGTPPHLSHAAFGFNVLTLVCAAASSTAIAISSRGGCTVLVQENEGFGGVTGNVGRTDMGHTNSGASNGSSSAEVFLSFSSGENHRSGTKACCDPVC